MSYKRFDPEDVVLSTNLVSTPVWTGNVMTLNHEHMMLSSMQQNSLSGNYYLDVYKYTNMDSYSGSGLPSIGDEDISGSYVDETLEKEVQFSIAYGDRDGFGSLPYNSNVPGYSNSRTVFGQYRTLVLGDEESEFYLKGDNAGYSNNFFAITIDRARYKEKLMLNSIELEIDQTRDGRDNLVLVDNSSLGGTVRYVDSGRLYKMIRSGSEASETVDEYGFFLPDTGIIILDADKLLSGSNAPVLRWSGSSSGNSSVNPNEELYKRIVRFKVQSEETVSSNFIFVRARNAEFNYSTNPSNVVGSGELRHNVMINQPQTFITSVGLYNDTNDLLAVAKLSRPLIKDFTKEAIIRIKLDY